MLSPPQGATQNPAAGIGFILLGMTAITFNDVMIKFLSGGYPLHQMVFARSAIGICFSLILVQMEGGWAILRTARPGLHLLRAGMVVLSNLTYFSALASLQLAEVASIFLCAPLLITLLSIPILGEKVGPLRLGAIAVGFLGVLIIVRPWEAGETRAAAWYIYLLPVLAALTYAINQLLTRKLGMTSKASALAVYIQAAFIIVTLVFGLVAGDGRFAEGMDNPSLIFLLRAWVWPSGFDAWVFLALGFNSAIVGYTLAQAYRMADAATVAPFEYIGLPLAVFWGWLIWSELPALPALAGIVLILGAGLFVFLRERQKGRRIVSGKRVHRRY